MKTANRIGTVMQPNKACRRVRPFLVQLIAEPRAFRLVVIEQAARRVILAANIEQKHVRQPRLIPKDCRVARAQYCNVFTAEHDPKNRGGDCVIRMGDAVVRNQLNHHLSPCLFVLYWRIAPVQAQQTVDDGFIA